MAEYKHGSMDIKTQEKTFADIKVANTLGKI